MIDVYFIIWCIEMAALSLYAALMPDPGKRFTIALAAAPLFSVSLFAYDGLKGRSRDEPPPSNTGTVAFGVALVAFWVALAILQKRPSFRRALGTAKE